MSVADAYYGDAARDYEQRRNYAKKWAREQDIVSGIASRLAPEATILDCPVGTGRFFEIYAEYSLHVIAADISGDMLSLAAEKARGLGLEVNLVEASMFELPLSEGWADLTVCGRLAAWLPKQDLVRALTELRRVTSGRVLITAHHRPNLLADPAVLIQATLRYALFGLKSFWRKFRDGRRTYVRWEAELHELFALSGFAVETKIPITAKRHGAQLSAWLLAPGNTSRDGGR